MKLCTACRRHVRPDAGACPFCGETLRTTASAAVGALVLLGALGASCTSRPVDESATGASTGTSTTTSTSTSTTTTPAPTTSTSSSGSTANSSTGELTTTNDVDTTDPGCAFYGGCPSDFPPQGKHCDVWLQDCPPGEKCMPYSSDGDNIWESLRCTPVAPNPGKHGDPCTVVGNGVSGVDSCDVGHMCWNLDMNGEGHCIAFCTGLPDMPMCDPPMTTCSIYSDGVLILCFPWCDALMQDCPAGETCVPNPMNQSSFICMADASGDEGQEFDPCEAIDGCDPGLFCGNPQNAIECDPMVIGCCLSFCDLTMPTCNGQNAECFPWYDMGQVPPGAENLGACVLPP